MQAAKGFAHDIGSSQWRQGEGWGASPTAGDACLGKSLGLGTSDAPKYWPIERDGKILDIGPNRSLFNLACLGDIQGKR